MDDILKMLDDSFKSVGSTLFTDEYLTKILVIIACSTDAKITHNIRLCEVIKFAKTKFNLIGGRVPDKKFAIRFQKLLNDVNSTIVSNHPLPKWVNDICENYQISKETLDLF